MTMLLLLLLVLVTYLLALTRCDIFCDTTQTSSSTTTNTGFFVAVDAFLPVSSSPFLLRQHSPLSSTPKVNAEIPAMLVDVNTDDDVQQQQRQQLPDFGTTTVEVDTIKLEKKTRARRRTTIESAEDDEAEEDVSAQWIRQDLFGSSLVDQTMEELQNDQDYLATQERIQKVGLVGITNEERKQRRRALTNLGIEPFGKFLATALHPQQQQQQQLPSKPEHETDNPPLSAVAATIPTTASHLPTRTTPYRLQRKEPKILQINIGLYCNQACSHCHVESSPMRTSEMMTTDTVVQCLELLKATPSITTLDITGGAPELNANFRYLVSTARAIRGPDLIIIDRCNLTVLQEPGQDDLVEFLQRHRVHIIASLPCYSADNVDTQRGGGVFERSIAGLLALNRAGYGHPTIPTTTQQDDDDTDGDGGAPLLLDLVYNPLGGFLPPPQEKLQAQYKTQLHDNFGILFNSLYTITNMPIKRFADFLHRRDELEDYMALLVRNFNPDTVSELMCLDTINIGWDGKIYDCDFNQQLSMPIGGNGKKTTVFDIDSLEDLQDINIRTDNHCFGCTAGMGSS